MNEILLNRRKALWMSAALLTAGCSRQQDQANPIERSKSIPPEPSIRDLWKRIETWLSAKAPKIIDNLNPAATDAEIGAAETALGCKMPDQWRQLYQAHNGMNSEKNLGSLFHGMNFLSLERAIREQANSNTTGAQPLPVRAADSGIRKADMHNPKWIAFGHDNGETLLRVDLDPGPGGNIGQVIFTDHADETVILLAPSLQHFLAVFVADLESGRYFLNKEALEEGDQFLDCDKEIDVMNWHKSPKWKHLAR